LLDVWGDYYRLPYTYAWRWLGYHLNAANRHSDWLRLRLDFKWLKAKLLATDINTLLADYVDSPSHTGLGEVADALRLSAHILVQYPHQTAGQLIGRLRLTEKPEVLRLLENSLQESSEPWLCPLITSLTPAGGPLIRTLVGHTAEITAL